MPLDTVAMEAYERVEDVELTNWRIGRMTSEALRAAIDDALADGPDPPPSW